MQLTSDKKHQYQHYSGIIGKRKRCKTDSSWMGKAASNVQLLSQSGESTRVCCISVLVERQFSLLTCRTAVSPGVGWECILFCWVGLALRDGWMDGIERWMAAAEECALSPSLFSLTVTMLPNNEIQSDIIWRNWKKKSSSLMERIVLCPDLLVEAIIRVPPTAPALCVFFFHCLEAALICLRQFYNKLRDAFFKSF